MTALRWTTCATLALTYALIVLGAWVRATGSGLSCPDWPTCYGHWVPLPSEIPADAGYTYFQVMLEWVHRLLAGVFVGPLILVIGVLAWRARTAQPHLPLYAAVLVVLLLVQAALGGVTVLDRNSPWSVAVHLSTALVLFSVLWLIYARTTPAPKARGGGAVGALGVAVWLVALGTMASAAMTAKSGASLACASWPLCNETLIPDLVDPSVRLNVTHRLLAAAAVIGTVALVFATAPGSRERRLANAALVLVVAEVALGALLVAWEIPVTAAVAHQALGVLVFALLSLLMWRAVGGPARQAQGTVAHVGVS